MTPAELIAALDGISTKEAAAWLGVENTTLWRYKTGRSPIPAHIAMFASLRRDKADRAKYEALKAKFGDGA